MDNLPMQSRPVVAAALLFTTMATTLAAGQEHEKVRLAGAAVISVHDAGQSDGPSRQPVRDTADPCRYTLFSDQEGISTWGHRFSDSAIVGKGKTAKIRSGVRKLTLALVGLCFADPTLTDLSQIHFG